MEFQKTLLIVEDDRDTRLFLERILLPQVHRVVLAENGVQASRVLSNTSVDLVLSDITMPDMDGLQLLREVRSSGVDLPFILLSGFADKDKALEALRLGAADLLEKPVDRETLIGAVKKALMRQSQQREAEGAIRQQHQLIAASAPLLALGRMAGGIAHEISNPLSVISGRMEQLRDLLGNTAVSDQERVRAHQLLERMEKTVQRITNIIRSMRSLALQSSQEAMEACSVRCLLEDAVEQCLERFQASGIELQLVDRSGSSRIWCRPIEISQVLVNLLSNAHDAVVDREEKWVRLHAVDMGHGVRISVTDSGDGIKAEYVQKIFEPFFTTKASKEGTGLGLSISRGIIEAHQGELFLDPTSTNTCFALELPKQQLSEESQQDKPRLAGSETFMKKMRNPSSRLKS